MPILSPGTISQSEPSAQPSASAQFTVALSRNRGFPLLQTESLFLLQLVNTRHLSVLQGSSLIMMHSSSGAQLLVSQGSTHSHWLQPWSSFLYPYSQITSH